MYLPMSTGLNYRLTLRWMLHFIFWGKTKMRKTRQEMVPPVSGDAGPEFLPRPRNLKRRAREMLRRRH